MLKFFFDELSHTSNLIQRKMFFRRSFFLIIVRVQVLHEGMDTRLGHVGCARVLALRSHRASREARGEVCSLS